MPNVQLTYDIWELITDILGDGLDSDRPSMLGLRNLGLTCKAMVPLCRRHLFATLYLASYPEKNPPDSRIGRFHELIANPTTIHYIRHLHHDIWFPDDVHLQQILDVLCTSASLRSIHLWGAGKDWSTFPKSFQTLLERLIHQPTVTTLDLSTMQSVPTSIFLGSTSITHITLGNVRFTHNDDVEVDTVNRIVSTARPKYLSANTRSYEGLSTLMQPSGQTQEKRAIDFSGLREGKFWKVDNIGEMEIVYRVLYKSKELRSLDIRTGAPVSWTGLGASLSAHVRTLKSLALGSYVDLDPFRDLVSELSIIAGMNILEELSLDVTIQGETASRADTGDWSGFDSLMTRPGSFPKLKTVTIDILWVVSGGDKEEIEARITQQNFPNLSESTAFELRVESDVGWM